VTSYDILLMLDPGLTEDRQGEIVARMREQIEAGGGKWSSHEIWGRRKLAYEIAHKDEGFYHLVGFDAEPETLDEISRILKITDGVMRHMPTRRIAGGSRPSPPPARSDRTPEYAANIRSQEEES
jgi:small subunit ribosomal protein S6